MNGLNSDHNPLILYVDAYDSFANNIVALLKTELNAHVEVIQHDDSRFRNDQKAFKDFLHHFNAVVAGPGPGHPANADDVGLIRELWSLNVDEEDQVLPVLGICLGFQSLCLTFGAEVKELQMPRHGVINRVTAKNLDIFENTKDFNVTSYHSLYVDLGPENASENQSDSTTWAVSKLCPELQSLAWDFTDKRNGPVLMAARHKSLPFWGVQYHPESICTDSEGRKIISDWWRQAQRWVDTHHRTLNRTEVPRPPSCLKSYRNRQSSSGLATSHLQTLQHAGLLVSSAITWRKFHTDKPSILKICESLGLEHGETVVFQSGRLQSGELVNPELGRYSIVGFVEPSTVHIQYNVASSSVTLQTSSHSKTHGDLTSLSGQVSDIWAYIRQFMNETRCDSGPEFCPFWGGLVGYIAYEAGLQSISVKVQDNMESFAANKTEKPDIHFVFITRSLVIDHVSGNGWILTTAPNDLGFLEQTSAKIGVDIQSGVHPTNGILNGVHEQNGFKFNTPKLISLEYPSKREYINKIQKCDSFIRKGDSYELCLTGQAKLQVQATDKRSGWSLFRCLSQSNPATFSSYMRLATKDDCLTVVGSSPERFLSWNRKGGCQFRPIKGTVKKSPTIGLQEATAILSSSKEHAENLMIADLIRHDLHGIAGAGNVHATKLMQIEEYATVFQLVSVIEGNLQSSIPKNGFLKDRRELDTQTNGIDVLAASLPPGSMTGAPKKRSCEILTEIEEHKPRGIYSGVIGYLDVGGGGDFSVVIRTAYRWDSETVQGPQPENGVNGNHTANCMSNHFQEQWTLGAGGAITAQSNVDDEYQEMLIKLNSVLGAFGTQVTEDRSG